MTPMPDYPGSVLEPGTTAPDFNLHSTPDQSVGLADRDHAWCHVEFARQRHLRFPLLADFHPKAEVAKQYGVYDDTIGMAERALFIVDAEGTISWSYVSPIGVNPGADGILTALEAMAPVGASA